MEPDIARRIATALEGINTQVSWLYWAILIHAVTVSLTNAIVHIK